MIVGTEWLIEATGCNKAALRDEARIRSVIDAIIADLGLISIGDVWHKFAGEGGVTGMVALTESHLACHTYPEHEVATFNLYCCRSRPEWDWTGELRVRLGAEEVRILRIDRGSPAAGNAGGSAV
jgi:S-adenosylmethionine decarboxylase